jgi:Flp pilus assembly protein TadD
MTWCRFRFPLAALCSLVALGACSAGLPSPADLDTYVKARDVYLRGDVVQAAALVSRIDSRIHGFHQARLLEGKILFFNGGVKESEQVFRGLVRQKPGYTEAELWLLRSLQAQGRTAEETRLLDGLLELNPADPRFLHQAGMARLAANDISGALAFFRRAQEYSVELSQSYIESARILYRFGLHEEALADLGRALALLPPGSALVRPVTDLQARIREKKK